MSEAEKETSSINPLDNLNRKNRRARLGALVSSLPGVMSGGVAAGAAYEATTAQPAAAEETYESQSPQAFITGYDKKLDAVIKKMPASPHFDTIGAKAINKVYRNSWHKNILVEHVGVPSKKYPGHYDWLAVSLDGDTGKTLWASINLGTDSKTYAGMNGVYKEGFGFFQADGDSGTFLPNSMLTSEEDHPGPSDTSHWFAVSTEGYPFKTPRPIMKYHGHEAEVSSNFNNFLAMAERIVNQK